MRKSGFIFDLDGVIVDTAKYHYLAWKDLANDLGFEFTKAQNERFKGVSRKKSLEILLEIGNVDATPEQFEHWMAKKNTDYLVYIDQMDEAEILPDVVKVLDCLKSNNVPISLGSASKNAKPILEKVNLLHYFDAIVDGNSVTKAKPDPEVFLMAAEQLGVVPEACVVFEDAIAGIRAANTAKMLSIGIGDKKHLLEADYVFSDFTEIHLDFIKNIAKI
ncbi:MAG: beta-phosphoglucomutase [Bacteroidota bacterium]